ncbi:hypothetical protein FB451DRAFT_1396250 [Mycena latifolia]|nr:hypothetical protein FB451DRAFT_1396250 [Mycena latifolia]
MSTFLEIPRALCRIGILTTVLTVMPEQCTVGYPPPGPDPRTNIFSPKMAVFPRKRVPSLEMPVYRSPLTRDPRALAGRFADGDI